MSTERPDGKRTPADGPTRTSGPPSGPVAGRLMLVASLGGPIIAAVSYGVTPESATKNTSPPSA